MRGMLAAAAILAAAGVLCLTGSAGAQEVALGGTTWDTTNSSCDVDGIDFKPDGTADVWDMTDDQGGDSAHWSVDGDALHLKYDNWYGGIEGTIYGGNRIEATETWRSSQSQEVHNDPCIFERK